MYKQLLKKVRWLVLLQTYFNLKLRIKNNKKEYITFALFLEFNKILITK